MPSFDELFNRATGNCPFRYQRRFAEEGQIPESVDVPTGWKGRRWRRWLGCGDFINHQFGEGGLR